MVILHIACGLSIQESLGRKGCVMKKSLPMCLISYCSPISHNLVMHLHLFCVLLQDERILSDGPLHKLLLEQLRVPVHWVAQLFCFEAPQSSCHRITKYNPRDVFFVRPKSRCFCPWKFFFFTTCWVRVCQGMSQYEHWNLRPRHPRAAAILYRKMWWQRSWSFCTLTFRQFSASFIYFLTRSKMVRWSWYKGRFTVAPSPSQSSPIHDFISSDWPAYWASRHTNLLIKALTVAFLASGRACKPLVFPSCGPRSERCTQPCKGFSPWNLPSG